MPCCSSRLSTAVVVAALTAATMMTMSVAGSEAPAWASGMTLHAEVEAHACPAEFVAQIRSAIDARATTTTASAARARREYSVVIEYDGGLRSADAASGPAQHTSVLAQPPLAAATSQQEEEQENDIITSPHLARTTVVVQFHLRASHNRLLQATSHLLMLVQSGARVSSSIVRIHSGPRPLTSALAQQLSLASSSFSSRMPPNGRYGIPAWDNIAFHAYFQGSNATRYFPANIDQWLHGLEYSHALYAAADVVAYDANTVERRWVFTGRGSNATLVAHVFNSLSNRTLASLFDIILVEGTPIEPPLPAGLPAGRNVYFVFTFLDSEGMVGFNKSLATLLWAPDYAALHAVQERLAPTKLKLYFDGPDQLALAHQLAVVPDDVLESRLNIVGRDAYGFPPPASNEGGGKKLVFVLVGVGVVVAVIGGGLLFYAKKQGMLDTLPCCATGGGNGDDDWAMATDNGTGTGGSNDLAAYHRLK